MLHRKEGCKLAAAVATPSTSSSQPLLKAGRAEQRRTGLFLAWVALWEEKHPLRPSRQLPTSHWLEPTPGLLLPVKNLPEGGRWAGQRGGWLRGSQPAASATSKAPPRSPPPFSPSVRGFPTFSLQSVAWAICSHWKTREEQARWDGKGDSRRRARSDVNPGGFGEITGVGRLGPEQG